jgi:hypothetical protein
MSLRASNYITGCGIPIFDYINVQYLTMVVIETYRVHKLDIYVFLVRYQNYSTKNRFAANNILPKSNYK